MKTRKQSQPTITAVIIENFKAFGARTTIPIKSLTALSGMNSSGKSSIYQALLLLEQSKYNQYITKNNIVYSLLLNGKFVHLGTSIDILHDKNNPTLTIGIQFSSGKEIISSFTKFEDDKVEHANINTMQLSSQIVHGDDFNYSIKLEKGIYQVEATSYFRFFDFRLSEIVDEWIKEQAQCKITDLPNGGYAKHIVLNNTICINMQNDSLYMVRIDKNDIFQLIDQDLLKKMNVDAHKKLISRVDECIKKNNIIDLISASIHSIQDFSFHTTHFIPPFRGFPKRFYSVLEKECFAYDYDILQSKPTIYLHENGEKIKETFCNALNYWIGVFFGVNKKIKVETLENLVQIVYLEDIYSKSIPLNNLGFGVGQILPILYRCLSANPGTLLIIDEPETHLHPSMQSKLADFFIQMALLGRNIIVETHSEYIIDKLIYHCIKNSKAHDVTKLYWVTNDSGESFVVPIIYDDLGYVNNAPEEFLSEKVKLVEELTALRFSKLDKTDKGTTA